MTLPPPTDEPLRRQSTVEAYVLTALEGFLVDPPDNAFQRGYMEALCAVYVEACGGSKTSPIMRAIDELRP